MQGVATAIAILRLRSGDARVRKEEPCFLVVQGHTARVRVTVDYHLGMLAPKSLGNMTVPTNRLMRFKNLAKIRRRDFMPLESFAFGIP